ncbi:von Willebrand factor A domain-containing protein 8-like [Mytilus trossulus]|uniref:von Willebrand factor A domain-containing protein 8-like n=1 Tax=Mytilus trossulus TaxID=6551 RepID=UPI003005469D
MFQAARMSVERSIRRLQVLSGTLKGNYGRPGCEFLSIRNCSSSSGKSSVSIGEVSINIKDAKNPELVPSKYLDKDSPQSILQHLQWIMQKDSLGQDIFLIGSPGPLRRQVAMMYLQLTNREGEYIALSRDTTESDIKQRREIHSGNAFYLDQCAVRAATHGRILLLEGIEKAERNVLPILNNLLENREMQLDDGRFLVAAERYDKLLEDHSKEELDQLKLVRVNERFRVIALGHPVPKYKGNPLDPPLRSRFQARDIHSPTFKEMMQSLQDELHNIPTHQLSQVLSFATAVLTKESNTLGLPDFPISNISSIAKILNTAPDTNIYNLIQRLYPYDVMLGKEGQTAVKQLLTKFELLGKNDLSKKTEEISPPVASNDQASVLLNDKSKLNVTVGTKPLNRTGKESFVPTPYLDNMLAEMIQSHMVGDFCIVGPRGSGKSAIVEQFAEMLGYHVEPIMLYQDMTSRDLLQQRHTLPNGDTTWRMSPLLTAAIEGNLAVLDGVHRINQGSFGVLHRLIHDRELQLFDGTRLLRQDRFSEIKEKTGETTEELRAKGIHPIHPSFRIIALAEPPVTGSGTQQWITPEMLTMFLFHNQRRLSKQEEMQVIQSVVKDCPDLTKLFAFVHQLRSSTDPAMNSVASSLSTRQLLRIAKRLAAFPSKDFHNVVQKACLARFLPRLPKVSLDQALEAADIRKDQEKLDYSDKDMTCEVKEGSLRIGRTSIPLYNPENRTKVPDILFYENHQHLMVMEDMMKDFLLGEHLLLVGNQGVGKNKIVDRFLQLLNRPREYIQLHRDTTVQTLTLQPNVKDGIIIFEDSPLVRAVKEGHVLVVDEADKALTHVTCILKTLVESGEMHLGDGRRIVPHNSGLKPSAELILSHPDFRMIVLANRPGFPFLGNDFFGALGDIFSCHAINNPDMESEMEMLKQYGPDVPEATLRKLVQAFGELRDLADQGLIAYPYSTREIVNMVKHLQMYPDEGLTAVVRNVFDFDYYNNELKETIVKTMQKHGIPFGATEAVVNLARLMPLPKFELKGQLQISSQGDRKHTALMTLPMETTNVSMRGPIEIAIQKFKLEKEESRSTTFSEQEAFWSLPMNETTVISDIAVTKAENRSQGKGSSDIIHIATANPVGLFTLNPRTSEAGFIDMYDLFPGVAGSYRPRVKLAPLAEPLDDNLLVHEEVANVLLSINYERGEVVRISSNSLPETQIEKRRFPSNSAQNPNPYKMLPSTLPNSKGTVIFFKQGGDEIVAFTGPHTHCISLPVNIEDVLQVGDNKWTVTATDNKKYLIHLNADNDFIFSHIDEQNIDLKLLASAPLPLSDVQLSKSLDKPTTGPNRVVVTPTSYATILSGFPDSSSIEVFSVPRTPLASNSLSGKIDPMLNLLGKPASSASDSKSKGAILHLPNSGQIVRSIPPWKVPENVYEKDQKPIDASGFLEITDVVSRTLRYIPVPGATRTSPYTSWLYDISDSSVLMAPASNDGLVTVDTGGCIRMWETALVNIERSLVEWRRMIGHGDDKPLQVTYDKESDRKADNPKHGKTDPTGAAHHGGNTWAGGTGGSNTAGLGGFGGPYRLDGGHSKVYQVPQWQKDQVPEEVKKAAREMAQKAFKERLKEINMSEYDAETYEKFSGSVRSQVQSLRVVLDSLQAKGKERQWLKNQSYGDLDDGKLIEGLTGEKAIYKRRGEKEPELGTPQEKPKRIRLVVDVSGSMYRFNGYDGRLEREMEATLMMMEAFQNYEEKFKYDIIGHSGEDHKLEICKIDKIPANNKERLVILKTMHAHSQFCLSGDNTLTATKHAIDSLAEEEADEHFVILLSDANFDRYGISPRRFGQILRSNDKVNAYAIFIGSLEDQASQLIKELPMGHAFACMDTKTLPQILQQIFTSTMLSSS